VPGAGAVHHINSGLMHRSKQRPYSINSSARVWAQIAASYNYNEHNWEPRLSTCSSEQHIPMTK
jgi:hypothetical protein